MKRWMYSTLTLGLLALPSPAQEETPPPPRTTTPPPAAAPALDGSCGFIEKTKTTYELHWLERKVPGVQTKQVLKEIKNSDTKPMLELEYNTEQVLRTETLLKPCEVVKEVTICTQKPIVTVDPVTGCSTVTYQPITETKLVKDVTYQLVTQDKVMTVQKPFLKPVEQPIVRKSLILETTVEPVIRTERFGVLVPVEIKERKPVCAPPPCTAPPCIK